ncbi:MAG: RpiB/LacA/LacB family sugar-phosphate isomerase [Oscillospiraceae bacterium]|nr:RpiB/LacA/LacB family sugar-phosphate isomerase [Oscillospiraceae bacterium]
MKTIKDKYIVMGSDGAGFPLKEAVKMHLEDLGWTVEDVGVKSLDGPTEMFNRVGFRVGAKISEGEYEKGLVFCGTGMGIHVAAGKCPHVQAGVVESVPAGKRAAAANNLNVLSMGAQYVSPAMAIEIVDEFLSTPFGGDYGEAFLAMHKLAWEEIDEFDYEAFKANGFEPIHKYDVEFKPGGFLPKGMVTYKPVLLQMPAPKED